jgi:hypothetical protein
LVIVKFIMVLFLAYLAWLAVYTDQRMQPKSGPNYYLDMTGIVSNSIQPQYRVSREVAMKSNHALEVECFNNGTPYKITKLKNGVRTSSTTFLIDGYGRLRYVIEDNGYGWKQMRQISPEP